MIRLRRVRKAPPRCWFRDGDGTYYRNCPLIAAERREVTAWPLTTPGKFAVLGRLDAEWHERFAGGVQRKPRLDPGDTVTEATSFREAYPHNPGLWVLDGDERITT
jgi:hypothetical protein